MLEIPETTTVAEQVDAILTGKKIAKVLDASSPHSFAWYHGDPKKYKQILEGKLVEDSKISELEKSDLLHCVKVTVESMIVKEVFLGDTIYYCPC